MAYMRSSLKRYGRPLQGFGDGPITSPDQVDGGEIQMPDDYVGSGFNPAQSTQVATVGPTIVPAAPDTSLIDKFKSWWAGLTAPAAAPAPGAPPSTTQVGIVASTTTNTAPDYSNLLILGALLGAGYYLTRKTPSKSVAKPATARARTRRTTRRTRR